jgi:Protein of unknown function (DUF2971)
MPTTQQRAQAAFNVLVQNITATVVAGSYARVAAIPMLSHYTSVEAFASILRSGQFWFSNIPDMAAIDTSEVIEGTQIISDALRTVGPQVIRTIPYAQMNAGSLFEQMKTPLLTETYAISLCEHGSDRQTDRLTMWHVYGHKGHGLCLVLRKETMLNQTAAGRFPVHWAPIDYDSAEQLTERVRHVLSLFEAESAKISPDLRALISPNLGSLIAGSMVPLVIGHKNPAYVDEREVRFVRTSLINIAPTPADAVYREVGTPAKPKRIFALPLRQYSEFGIDASMQALLDHIIIGPSNRQDQLYAETRALLDAHGLSHVEIRRSTIPFRAP